MPKYIGLGQDVTPPAATALGSAGNSMIGYAQMAALLNRNNAINEELALRGRQIDNAERALEASIAQHQERLKLDRQREKRMRGTAAANLGLKRDALAQKNDQQALDRASAARGNELMIRGLMAAYGGAEGGEGAPDQPSELGPEMDAFFGHVKNLASDPSTDPKVGAQMVKGAATLATRAAQRHAGRQIIKQLQDEVSSGYWSSAQGLGVDVDGDELPDAVAEVPTQLLQLLQGGADPKKVAELHYEAKRAIDSRKAALQRRTQVLAESQQMLGSMGSQVQSDDAMELERWSAAWQRGEFGDTPEGELEFKQGLQTIASGRRPMKVNVGGHELDLAPRKEDYQAAVDAVMHAKRFDPQERATEKARNVARFLRPFNPENETGETFEQWLARANEISIQVNGEPLNQDINMAPKGANANFGGAPSDTQASYSQAPSAQSTAPNAPPIQPTQEPPATESAAPAQAAAPMVKTISPLNLPSLLQRVEQAAAAGDEQLQSVLQELQDEYGGVDQEHAAKFKAAIQKGRGR